MKNENQKIKYTKFKVELASNGWLDWTCENCGHITNDDYHVYVDECPNCKAKNIDFLDCKE